MKPDTKPDRELITVLLENTAHMQVHDAAQHLIGVFTIGTKSVHAQFLHIHKPDSYYS